MSKIYPRHNVFMVFHCRIWSSIYLKITMNLQIAVNPKKETALLLCTYLCQAIGWGFDRSLWLGGRAFELSCSPGSRDIWIFVRARDHKSFLQVGNFSYIWRHIFAWGYGNLTAIFRKMSKSHTMPRLPCCLWGAACKKIIYNKFVTFFAYLEIIKTASKNCL